MVIRLGRSPTRMILADFLQPPKKTHERNRFEQNSASLFFSLFSARPAIIFLLHPSIVTFRFIFARYTFVVSSLIYSPGHISYDIYFLYINISVQVYMRLYMSIISFRTRARAFFLSLNLTACLFLSFPLSHSPPCLSSYNCRQRSSENSNG